MKLKNQSYVFKMTLLGLSLALYIALSFAAVNLEFTRISMTGIPVIFAAVVFGPIEGMFIGGVGEFFVQLMTYGLMPTTPLWLLAPIARGLIVGLLFKHKNIKNHYSLWILTVFLCCLAVTGLNTIAIHVDSILYETEQLEFIRIVFRFVGSIISSIIYILVVPTLFGPLVSQGKFTDEEEPEPSVKEIIKTKLNISSLATSTAAIIFSIVVIVLNMIKFSLALFIVYLAVMFLYVFTIYILEQLKKKGKAI